MAKIKVLIVDDSAIVRKKLTSELNRQASIEVIGTAPDPYIARDKIVQLKPDVLVLDVEMPRMDGITFLQKLMAARPMPVIIFSSLTPAGSQTSMEAFDAGAVDVVCKPGPAYSVGDACEDLAEKVRAAAQAKLQKMVCFSKARMRKHTRLSMAETTNKIFAIGASTGGVQALARVLHDFPANAPGTVIVQHMPPKFTASFASRLDKECAVCVKEAREGDSVIPGQVLIAPGGFHMELRRSGANYRVTITDGPRVNHQKPSVDVLFHSVAKYAGANVVGAILTGMGNDGAEGLLAMKQQGALTIAEDEKTCIVYGMPKAAAEIGAADYVVPLGDVAKTMIKLVSQIAVSAS